MKTVTLNEITNDKGWVGLGIAGNQAEHLDQAGEADDFKDVVALENAPKGIFPWYISGASSFLGNNPLSNDRIRLHGSDPLQPEPEIALIVKFEYCDCVKPSSDKLVNNISVVGFSVFNDCSRRINADKISLKKNWGEASQGMAQAILPINDFTNKVGTINKYRLGCYLERGEKLIQYGKDTAVTDYCYFNETLINWMIHQINNQVDYGPLEALAPMLAVNKPEYGIIGIGATCYSEFGNSESRFLRNGDKVLVVAYDSNKYHQTDVEQLLGDNKQSAEDGSMLVLKQEVMES